MQDLTLEKAKTLKRCDIIYHKINKNSNGTHQKWKVNGKIKLWLTDKNRFQIPVKHGLYSYGYIDQHNFKEFMIDN